MDNCELSRNIMNDAYIIAQCTNKLIIDRLENIVDSGENNDIDNIKAYGIDVRIFNKEKEIRYFRPTIGDGFMKRTISDVTDSEGKVVKPGCGEDYIDQYQYLDIDTDRSSAENLKSENLVMATGGGLYHLPKEGMENGQIHVRNYVNYEKDTGRVYFVDFRCVGFDREGR